MVRLLLNPDAGRGRGRRLAARLAAAAGCEVIIPHDAEEVHAHARRAADEGIDRLLVAGGDGTLHHAIRGLAGSRCALGIVPLGSGNDLARSLGVPSDPEAAVQRALRARPERIDLGRVGDRTFACVAGVGFDGEVARFVNERSGPFRGAWAYAYAVARTLAAFRPPRLRIDFENGVYEGRVMLAALANSPCFGGGMRVAPQASMNDGRLDLVVVEAISRVRFLAAFPRVYRGTHLHHPAVRSFRVAGATLSADRDLPVYADGEPVGAIGSHGLRVDIVPAALAVLV